MPLQVVDIGKEERRRREEWQPDKARDEETVDHICGVHLLLQRGEVGREVGVPPVDRRLEHQEGRQHRPVLEEQESL